MSDPRPAVPPSPAPVPRALALAAVLAACALLAACGGSDPARNAAASEHVQEQRDETKLADFARCMREHGIKAETVTGPGGGRGIKIGARPGAPERAEWKPRRRRARATAPNPST